MAKLHRMVKLNDRHNTHVFTFLLPPGVAAANASQDVFGKEFLYGHQRWTVSAVRGDQHLGVYLALANAYDGMTCTVDFTATLLNQGHYTKNETYVERGCVFDSRSPRQGRRSFVALADLATRGFQMPFAGGGGGWFHLELEMRNCRSIFEQVLEQSREVKGPAGSRYPRYETSCFSFGSFDWTAVLRPNGDGDSTDGRALFGVLRQTSFDHTSRLSYRLTLERADQVVVRTEPIESVVDASGLDASGHVLAADGEDPVSGAGQGQGQQRALLFVGPGVRGQLKIRLELMACTTLTEVQLFPFNNKRNRAYLYDRDKQAWMLESDVSGDRLALKLYYGDIRNIPRGHLRYVGWRVHVLPAGQVAAAAEVVARCNARNRTDDNGCFYHYYLQTDVDEGFAMTTDVPMAQVRNTSASSAQLNGNGVCLGGDGDRLTIQVEWLESQLLFHEKWQLTDNVVVQHKHQMWRELQALQAENYALEKQVHSYQLSIARNNAKWSQQPEEGEDDNSSSSRQAARGSGVSLTRFND